jgi:hypothetical protein
MATLLAPSSQHQSDRFKLYLQDKRIDRLRAPHNTTPQTTVMAREKIGYRREFVVIAE